MIDGLHRLKFEVRALAAREPRLAMLYAPFRWWSQLRALGRTRPRERVVGPHTELVIDGMQGSGNSFVTAAFQLAQQRRVEVAHHLHSPAQIIGAARRGVPVLVTIREPAGTVLSLVSRWPYVRLGQALREYVRFYRKVQCVDDRIVVGLFPESTRDLGSVIGRVNERFGTDFVPFEHTEENMRRLRDPAELGSVQEGRRREFRARKAEELESAQYDSLRREAEAVYRRYEELAERQREAIAARN
ncbi:MAG: hypothetical protein ACOC46_00675 [Pirellulales bacterium]